MSHLENTKEPIGPFCAWLGSEAVIYYDWIYPIMYSLGGSLMIPLITIYVRSYIVNRLNISRLAFAITLTYFTIQFITYVLIAIWARYQCHSYRISTPIHIVGITLYTSQTLILMGLLFYRLYRTYHGVPSLSLSKCTLITFTIFYVITCIAFLSGSTLYVISPAKGGTLLYSISSIFTICLAVSLFGVYIFKMYSIYKTTKDEDFISLITKNSLLAIFSISVTLFNFVLFAFVDTAHSAHYGFFVDIFIVTDIYTNALCIFLSYKTFDPYYYKICGLCDTHCIRKCVVNENAVIIKRNMELETTVDSGTNKSCEETVEV